MSIQITNCSSFLSAQTSYLSPWTPLGTSSPRAPGLLSPKLKFLALPARHWLDTVSAPGRAKSVACPLPDRELCWSRIRRWFVRNFQILIVSAVETCKRCLPTPGLRSWRPLSPTAPEMKILGPPVTGKRVKRRRTDLTQWRRRRAWAGGLSSPNVT